MSRITVTRLRCRGISPPFGYRSAHLSCNQESAPGGYSLGSDSPKAGQVQRIGTPPCAYSGAINACAGWHGGRRVQALPAAGLLPQPFGGRRRRRRLDTDPSAASRSRSTWVLLRDAFVRASELGAVGVARASSIARRQTIIARHVAGKENKKRYRDHGALGSPDGSGRCHGDLLLTVLGRGTSLAGGRCTNAL